MMIPTPYDSVPLWRVNAAYVRASSYRAAAEIVALREMHARFDKNQAVLVGLSESPGPASLHTQRFDVTIKPPVGNYMTVSYAVEPAEDTPRNSYFAITGSAEVLEQPKRRKR